MEQDIIKRLEVQEEIIMRTYASVEKMRKYMMWTGIITVAFIVLPMVGLIFVIPKFMDTYSSILGV